MLRLHPLFFWRRAVSHNHSTWMGALVALLVCAGVLLGGCSSDAGEERSDGCVEDSDCPGDDSCLRGMCVARDVRQCQTAAQCPSDAYECANNRCRLRDFDAGNDSGVTPPDTHSPSNNSPGEDTGSQHSGDAPRVLSTVPTDGAEDVATDIALRVTFSKEMDPTTLNFYSIFVRDADQHALEVADITYDSATHTATIELAAPLKPAEGYTLHVGARARDLSRNGVDPEATIRFSTIYPEPAEYAALAQKWAPVIYQGLSADVPSGVPARASLDIPTRLDFDQNQNARDNLDHARAGQIAPPAHVYYAVSESIDYYFLHYILYYPARFDAATDQVAEHGFAGIVVVVDKQRDALHVVEAVTLRNANQLTMAFRPDPSPVRKLSGDFGAPPLQAFAPALLEDGTRFALYVAAGVHEACHWHQGGLNGLCMRAPAEFPGSAADGVLMRPGAAQTLAQATRNADSGMLEMTYELTSFAREFWMRRDQGGGDGLFGNLFTYRPVGDGRPAGTAADAPRMIPRYLASDAAHNFGQTPFSWLPSPGQNNNGQWLLDPAYILPQRYQFGAPVRVDYCYNLYFGIDQLGATGRPDCAR